MYRAVVLTSLVILLLAVAGVSVAQDGRILAGGSNSADPAGSTTLEQTLSESTVGEDPETSTPPSTSPEPDGGEGPSEPTVITEPTVESTGEAPVAEETRAPGSNNIAKPGTDDGESGKPERASKASEVAKSPHEVGHPGRGKPRESGHEAENGRGGGQQKVTLCHKGTKTLTVGAPALGAHLRHGDTQGACRPDGAGPGTSGEAMGPEAAGNGGRGDDSGGQRVVLCHKARNTLAVGASSREAHLQHGDRLGACL